MTISKKTAIRIGAALMLAASALNAHFAHAQDFTGMDLTAMNYAWNTNQNAMMNDQLGQIIWQNMNDPRIQAMYQQQVSQGLFWGTLEEFAYKFAYTGGMSAGGYANAMGVSDQLNRDFQGQMAGSWANGQVYYDAYGAYGNGYANNQANMGSMMIYGY